MSHYSNPAENAVIGAVDREIRKMEKEAQRFKRLREAGRLTAEDEMRARQMFTGIHRRFLREALGE